MAEKKETKVETKEMLIVNNILFKMTEDVKKDLYTKKEDRPWYSPLAICD